MTLYWVQCTGAPPGILGPVERNLIGPLYSWPIGQQKLLMLFDIKLCLLIIFLAPIFVNSYLVTAHYLPWSPACRTNLSQKTVNSQVVAFDLWWKNTHMRLGGCCDLIIWFPENITIYLIVLRAVTVCMHQDHRDLEIVMNPLIPNMSCYPTGKGAKYNSKF